MLAFWTRKEEQSKKQAEIERAQLDEQRKKELEVERAQQQQKGEKELSRQTKATKIQTEKKAKIQAEKLQGNALFTNRTIDGLERDLEFIRTTMLNMHRSQLEDFNEQRYKHVRINLNQWLYGPEFALKIAEARHEELQLILEDTLWEIENSPYAGIVFLVNSLVSVKIISS